MTHTYSKEPFEGYKYRGVMIYQWHTDKLVHRLDFYTNATNKEDARQHFRTTAKAKGQDFHYVSLAVWNTPEQDAKNEAVINALFT